MSSRDVVTRILNTARDFGPPGRDDQTGVGGARPYHALTENPPPGAKNYIYDELDAIPPRLRS